ncbi:hypothetical protein BVX99_01335 [bacterium F16]|nr:hypothetical protein BVX99_01335 [bacterium F16]
MSTSTPSFKFFPSLNAKADMKWASSRTSINVPLAKRFFASESLQDKLVRAMAEKQVIPIKEVLECFEYVALIRKAVRSACVADLCCGHGLAGMLLGIFEKSVEQVLLVDRKRPQSHEKLFAVLAEVAPWLHDKVSFQVQRLDAVVIPHNSSVVSAHACGVLTDTCIDMAIATGGAIAVMPCCYPKRLCPAPAAICNEFGEAVAFDIDRTYRLEQAGYHVRWSAIPSCITPMNRVIIGRAGRTVGGADK